jgi:lysophospholipase L1-like esterase
MDCIFFTRAASLVALAVLSTVARGQQDDLAQTYRVAYKVAVAKQSLADELAPKGSTILIGDSILFYMPDMARLGPRLLNLSIVGDTTSGIVSRLSSYKSLGGAATIVLEGGVNDLQFRVSHDEKTIENYRYLIKSLAIKSKLVLLGIFRVDEKAPKVRPGWNARIDLINEAAFAACRSTPDCLVVDLNPLLSDSDGNLRQKYHRVIDGIHPNNLAYDEVIVPKLKAAVDNSVSGRKAQE